ncbi:Ankyrin repeats (3 copies) [Legionella wadsworthii]|uniref:Ankyrin repeats (3 copies) n=1 Tax=Legionella wadsworthii TaxID=28088 RepID=A0A378LXU9_9GAMM|nr:ankyrin repeat domain-containing protein [Legionella wadsworthii]STY31461.1 Ankyrin repeats (3 copies) [Legionella wadsworthii]
MPFYYSVSQFNSLDFLDLPDKELLTFIRLNNFSPNADWAEDNPVLHYLLANELFDYVARLLTLIPERINPNLCDGAEFGKKSLLILLTLLPSNDSLIFKFMERYQNQLLLDYQDENGKTALHYAIILGRADIAERLITLGASIEVSDNEGFLPFDYLYCPGEVISTTLKMVDIEPLRDTNAASNQFEDHADRPMMLQGMYLIQCKETLKNLIKGNLVLVKYIEGKSPYWGTFIGDDCPLTYGEMREFAQKIASNYKCSLSEVFVNQKLGSDEQVAFRTKLKELSNDFSGQSIIQKCSQGHDKIAKLLHKLRNEMKQTVTLT